MNKRKQMAELRLRHVQVERQNKLDDGQVEGYHKSGTSPLSGNCGLGKRQFLQQGWMSFFCLPIR
ncbi:hypothetical protein ACX12E_17595 [Paenibacillus vandeheii]